MSESAALQSWRRRAQRTSEGPRLGHPARPVAATVAVAGLCALLGGRALSAEGAAPSTPMTTVGQPRDAGQSRDPGPAPCPAVATAVHADVDGDGCDEDVTYADGVLTAANVRMAVGEPTDEVALGRWTCSTVTAAVLRPATGEVFRFDGWASAGHNISAVYVGRVTAAVSIAARSRPGTACDDIAVSRESGPPVLLPERPVAG